MKDIQKLANEIKKHINIGFDYSNGKDKTALTFFDSDAEMIVEALEKQIKPEEAKALQGSMMLVGQWISRETQARKYSTDEVMNISKALMDLKAHFDKLEVAE